MRKIILFFVLSMLFFSIIPLTKNANARLILVFNSVSDPSSAYTNDNNAWDNNILTYAYTSTYTNDNWLELTNNNKDACLCNSTYIAVGWYRLLGGLTATAQKVDVEIAYTEDINDNTFTWYNIVTDGSYTYGAFTQIYFDKLVYLNGVRVRSYDSSHLYGFRVMDIWMAIYSPGLMSSGGTMRYCPTTSYFNVNQNNWYNVTSGSSYANCSVNSYYNFTDYYDFYNGDNYFVPYEQNGLTTITVNCSSTAINIIENIINATGNTEYIYDNIDGFIVWSNYTGNTTICNSTNIQLFENIINATGTHEYIYDSVTGFKVYANYTGNTTVCNSTNISFIENLINTTGTHEYIYNATDGYVVFLNYTGSGSACSNFSGIYYLNYYDENLTFNATIFYNYHNNCTVNLSDSVTNAEINENNWLNLMGTVLFDNAQFFLIILISIWLFFVSKSFEKETHIFCLIQFMICIPLFLYLVSLSYLNTMVYGYLVSVAVLFAGIVTLILGQYSK